MTLRGFGLCALGAIWCAIVPGAQAQSANPPAQQPPASAVPVSAKPAEAPATAAAPNKYIVVPSGTILPMVLHNAVSTRSAQPGDPVYLETLFPILIDSKITIPAGSYVSGEVTSSKRPGRVKGVGQISIKLDNLILPNGYQVQFNAVPKDAGTGGNETVGKEGTITGDSNKAGDANTVAETTLAGAGIGGLAGRSGKAAGIGAGAGLVGGLAAVLLTRGPEAELPRGTTLDVSLNRPLYLLSSKIDFTSPGRASTLPGPPARQQPRDGLIPHN